MRTKHSPTNNINLLWKKLWLIIQREYLTRVKKKSFLLATFLTPIAFGLFFIVIGFIFSYEGGETLRIAVVDEGEVLGHSIGKDEDNLYFHIVDTPLEELRDNFEEGKYDGILVIPKIHNLRSKQHSVYYYRETALGLEVRSSILHKIRQRIRHYKTQALNLNQDDIQSLNVDVVFQPQPIREGQEDSSSMDAWIAAALGGMMGVIMYMTVFYLWHDGNEKCDGRKNEPDRRSDDFLCKTFSIDDGENHWRRSGGFDAGYDLGDFDPFIQRLSQSRFWL